MPALPTEAAEITPEWLTATLRTNGHLPQGRVASLTHTIIGEGVGFLGELARFQVTYDGAAPGAPATLISKIPTKFASARALGVTFGFYEREGNFFEHIAPGAALRVPRCYASFVDTAAEEFLLLLEDISPARTGDQLAGATLEEARLALDEIARFHAQWWDSPRLTEVAGWIPRYEDPVYAYLEELFPACIQPFLDFQAEDYPRDRMLAILDDTGGSMRPVLEKCGQGHQVLVHGDFRLDNMMFDTAATPGHMTLIDWQLLVRGNPGIDVGYFLSQSMTTEMRRLHERELVERYRQGLVAGGVRGYTAQECWDDYRFGLMLMFGVPVQGTPNVDLSNPRAVSLMRALSERATAAILDLDAVNTLPGK